MRSTHLTMSRSSVADADGDGFLTYAEMSRRAHLLLFVALGQQFFGQSNLEQSLVQRDKQIGADFVRRLAILL